MKFTRLIVCAAIRHTTTEHIICGVRHGDCLNMARYYKDGDQRGETWECGFVDQERKFMTRAEAWKVADSVGQIRRPRGFERNYDSQRKPNIGDEGLLFSENLY